MEVKIRACIWGPLDSFKKELNLFINNAEFESSLPQRAFDRLIKELNVKSNFTYAGEHVTFAKTDFEVFSNNYEQKHREYEFLNGWVCIYYTP